MGAGQAVPRTVERARLGVGKGRPLAIAAATSLAPPPTPPTPSACEGLLGIPEVRFSVLRTPYSAHPVPPTRSAHDALRLYMYDKQQ